MIRDKASRGPLNDGLASARFLVKALVIISFLLLVTGINYATTGQTPSLWTYGDATRATADQAVHFLQRKIREDDVDNCTAAILAVQVDKCAFVQAQCESEGFIDYLDFYYCTARNPSGWVLLIFLLLLYFYLLGGTAERFFCPALCRLSAGLKMSPNVAGVTLLALGNGSPDIFSTIASVQQNLFGQALGSLLGGGMFVTSVVVGSVTLASKGVVPKVTRRPFLRDLGFYIAALVVIFFICWDGNIRLWQSIVFIGFYITYVVVIVVGRLIYQRRKKARIAKMSLASATAADLDKDEFEFVGTGTGGKSYDDYDEDDALTMDSPNLVTKTAARLLHADSTFYEPRHTGRRPVNREGLKERMAKRMAALGVYIAKVGFWRNKTKGELRREVRMTLAREGHMPRRTGAGMRQTVQRISDLSDLDDDELSSDMEDEEGRKVNHTVGWGIGSIVNHQLLSINNQLPESDVDDGIIDQTSTYADDAPLLDDTDDFEEPDYGWEGNIDDSTWKGAIRLNWRNLKEILEWDEAQTIRATILMFADFPRLFFQHFTIHFAEPDTYFRPFYVFQPLGIAMFLLTAFGGWTLKTFLPGPLAAWIIPLSIILCVVVYFTTKNTEPPVYEWLFICVGLLMSILWIYFVAQELVAILSAAGKILRISNAIMGLTVLAWGNSIGDMVSNVVVSRKGFPQMAISASYASPLSNMLLGLGISTAIRIAKLRGVSFSVQDQLSNTVFWGFIFLMGSLSTMIIVIPLSKFRFLRPVGFMLLAIYAAFTLISLLTEFNIIFHNITIWDKWPGRRPN